MASSLSNLVNNFADGIHKTKCKCGHDKKNLKHQIKYKDCERCLVYTDVKDNLIEYKYLCCNKNYQKMFNKNLKKRFGNT